MGDPKYLKKLLLENTLQKNSNKNSSKELRLKIWMKTTSIPSKTLMSLRLRLTPLKNGLKLQKLKMESGLIRDTSTTRTGNRIGIGCHVLLKATIPKQNFSPSNGIFPDVFNVQNY
jgi:hypothetical protein